MPFRLDRTSDGGGIITYVRQDIPYKQLNTHKAGGNMVGIFFDIKKNKRAKNGFYLYNPKKETYLSL